MAMKVNVESCVKNRNNLDIQSEVWEWFCGPELEAKLQEYLESKIKGLKLNKKWIEEGYVTTSILKSVISIEEQILIMTAE